MRPAVVLALVTAACSPEIVGGSYYCGPERLCPPHLECDDNSYKCVSLAEARPFACPTTPIDSEQYEPDDDLARARDAGELSCGEPLIPEFRGCIRDGDDVDVLSFVNTSACNGDDPRVLITLTFPVALVPLAVELLDEDGEVIATGEEVTQTGNLTGRRGLRLEVAPQPGRFYVRIRPSPGAPDCDGACRRNLYTLEILFPLA